MRRRGGSFLPFIRSNRLLALTGVALAAASSTITVQESTVLQALSLKSNTFEWVLAGT
jgi:hypothetical protein